MTQTAPSLITVAGQIGSGKTAVCREISSRTNWEVISAGGILRKMAVESNMTVLEFNEYLKLHPEIDRDVDQYLETLAKSEKSLLIDSRLAWHFIPSSKKLYLIVDPWVGAERVFTASRTDENHASIDAASSENLDRQKAERERYLSLYQIDCQNWRNYDHVLDTTDVTPEKIADRLLPSLAAEKTATPQYWISPKRLQPAGNQATASRETIEIAVADGIFYMLSGFDKVSEALNQAEPLLACKLIAFENEPFAQYANVDHFAKATWNRIEITHWETRHGFKFRSYPNWVKPNSVKPNWIKR